MTGTTIKTARAVTVINIDKGVSLMKECLIITAILTAVIAGGCGHGNRHSGCGGHSHDEHLQLGAYCCDLEVFVDASPFVAGQTSNITAYFSHLENFKPLASGRVTASLIIGAGGVRQTLDKPAKAGVYYFRLNPSAAGSGKIVFDIETPQGKSQIVVPNITVYEDEHEAREAAAAAAVTSSDGVVFTKEQRWKSDFATAEVERAPFGHIIRTAAQIQPSQSGERIISAHTSGIVHFNTVMTEGITVNSGQTLFTIDGSAAADNNLSVRYAEAENEYNRAKAEFERKAELAKVNIVSQSDLLRARTEFTNAEAIYNNMRRNFSAGRQSARSPITGFVTRVMAQKGQYVEAGQPILVVSQNRDLFIRAELRPRYFHLLNNIASVNIRPMNGERAFSLEELGGRVLSYGRSTDVSNPLVPVVFQINNSAGFIAGSFVELFIKTQNAQQAIIVPNESIVEEMGSNFVFVQLTPEYFEKRAVRIGMTDGVHTEIREGNVAAGERVVSRGAILVKLAQASGALDPHAGHAH